MGSIEAAVACEGDEHGLGLCWFRIQFYDHDKHCIVPEVSRTHHVAMKGNSVTKSSEIAFLDAMAMATHESPCTADDICDAFGDISYLSRSSYESRLESVLESSTVTVLEKNAVSGILASTGPLVVPFHQRSWVQFPQFYSSLGLLPSPSGSRKAQKTARKALWGAEVRSDYYGLIQVRNYQTETDIFLVQRDSASSMHFCPPEYHTLDVDSDENASFNERSGQQGKTCTQVCKKHDEVCVDALFGLVNTCAALKRNFACEHGCMAQVGKELPVYVSDPVDISYQQCLITLQGQFSCASKHPHTDRLCPCKTK